MAYTTSTRAVNVALKDGTAAVLSGGYAAGDTARNFENVTGSAFTDVLTGNSARYTLDGGGGADKLNGGSGNDRLVGGAGRDSMTGGAGSDIFDFDRVSDIGMGSTRDVILDFTHLADDIDLSSIDANGTAAGNTGFAFLAKSGAAFTGVKGSFISPRLMRKARPTIKPSSKATLTETRWQIFRLNSKASRFSPRPTSFFSA